MPSVFLLLGAGQAANDAKRIQGTWTIEVGQKQGKKEPAEKLKHLRVIIRGDTFQIKEGDNDPVEEFTFKLDPSKKPKAVDLHGDLGLDADKGKRPCLGIYELEGETLKLCWRNQGGERPVEFAIKPGQQDLVLMILKREKTPKSREQAKAQDKSPPTLAEVPRVTNLLYASDGSFVLLQYDFDSLGIWDTTTGRFRVKMADTGHRSWDCIPLSPDGKKAAAINFVGRALKIWDVTTGKLVEEQTLPEWRSGQIPPLLKFSADSAYL